MASREDQLKKLDFYVKFIESENQSNGYKMEDQANHDRINSYP